MVLFHETDFESHPRLCCAAAAVALRARAGVAAAGGGRRGLAAGVHICREGSLRTCHLMCELYAKVERILRECAVPWTAARRRYVLLYCALQHLDRRKCARRRHVRDCVHAIIRDYMEQTHGDRLRGVSSSRLLVVCCEWRGAW